MDDRNRGRLTKDGIRIFEDADFAGGHGHEAHFPNIGVMLLSFVGIGGAFIAFVGFTLKGKKLVPIKDPRLHESVSLQNP